MSLLSWPKLAANASGSLWKGRSFRSKPQSALTLALRLPFFFPMGSSSTGHNMSQRPSSPFFHWLMCGGSLGVSIQCSRPAVFSFLFFFHLFALFLFSAVFALAFAAVLAKHPSATFPLTASGFPVALWSRSFLHCARLQLFDSYLPQLLKKDAEIQHSLNFPHCFFIFHIYFPICFWAFGSASKALIFDCFFVASFQTFRGEDL